MLMTNIQSTGHNVMIHVKSKFKLTISHSLQCTSPNIPNTARMLVGDFLHNILAEPLDPNLFPWHVQTSQELQQFLLFQL